MLFPTILFAALPALFLSPTTIQAAPTAGGSLSVVNSELLTITIGYSTSDPFSTNWIALYPLSASPTDGEKPDSAALSWKYAPDAKGTVSLDVETLAAGDYLAYFLAREGYKSLAKPITVTKKATLTPFTFLVSNITLRNARQGDPYEAKINGMANRVPSAYQIIPDSSWVRVSKDGVLSGTPTKDEKDTTVVIRATAVDGSTSELKATIPVREAGTPLVPELRVMTFNLWIGGTQVIDAHSKQIRFIADTNVDIIGMQDTGGGHPKRLADALGWYYWQPERGNIGTISRYPIVKEYGTVGTSGGVRVSLGDTSEVNFWSMHLEWTPYGPYDFCFKNMTVDQVLQRERESNRATQIADILKAMDGQLATEAAKKTPVILVGDANAPSHLDWTEPLRKKNCGYAGVPWPTSVKPTEAGLIDSFRVAHPDPAEVPGTTWSPLHLVNAEEGIIGNSEPQDRIDFIYHKGSLEVLDSKVLVVGKPKPFGEHKNNEWTSDHAAVLTTYKL
ncbi:hypothetical protein ABW20_dc0100051 [Dactylellina cionopaga]|nr:hypothetical protein ABW20_dc0100051 [Dactylellina cionopaga]